MWNYGVIHVFTSSQQVQLVVQTGESVQEGQSGDPADQRRGPDPQQQFIGCNGPQLDRLHQCDLHTSNPQLSFGLPVSGGWSRGLS